MIIYILLEDKNSKLSKRISTKRIITKVTSRDRSRLSRISLHSLEKSPFSSSLIQFFWKLGFAREEDSGQTMTF